MNNELTKQINEALHDLDKPLLGSLDSYFIYQDLASLVYLHSVDSFIAQIIEAPVETMPEYIQKLIAAAKGNNLAKAVIEELSESLRRSNAEAYRAKALESLRSAALKLTKIAVSPIFVISELFDLSEQNSSAKYGAGTTANVVNDLMAKLVSTNVAKLDDYTIYDPAAGEGRSLLATSLQLPKDSRINLLGHELQTFTKQRADLMLSLMPDNRVTSSIDQTNTLTPQKSAHKPAADIVISDPPYSMRWSADNVFLKDSRFASAKSLPPKSKADLAFVLDGLSHLKDDGTMLIQLPHGVLFRGGSEERIRQYLIDNNLIDAVIGLPAGLNYSTAIPTMLMVLRKNRARKEILFVDASEDGEKKMATTTLTDEAIKRIVDTYKAYNNVPQYAHVATAEEVAENDGNLNIPRYVDSFVPPEVVPISTLDQRIAKYRDEIAELEVQTQSVMAKYHPSH